MQEIETIIELNAYFTEEDKKKFYQKLDSVEPTPFSYYKLVTMEEPLIM